MLTINYKYKDFHSKLECICPLGDLKSIEKEAFRFVFKNLNHKNNYLPPLAINPSRIDESETCDKVCEGFALSFYETEKQANTKLKKILERKPLLADTLGNCIAKTFITKKDGVADKSKKDGHFNFHETEQINFKFKYEIVKEISIG